MCSLASASGLACVCVCAVTNLTYITKHHHVSLQTPKLRHHEWVMEYRLRWFWGTYPKVSREIEYQLLQSRGFHKLSVPKNPSNFAALRNREKFHQTCNKLPLTLSNTEPFTQPSSAHNRNEVSRF